MSAAKAAAREAPPKAAPPERAPTAAPTVAQENNAARNEAAAAVHREERAVRSSAERRQGQKIARADAFDPTTGDRVQKHRAKLDTKHYESELARLQVELVKLQEWIHLRGLRVVCLFEGRDAAGKGGVIKRITETLNPRICRICALGIPTEREKSQWYFQRYVAQLPAAGEWVLFDRSWYNRAGVEHVMGFCTPDEYRRFLHQCPIFERLLVEDGILLVKYWFSVSDEEQERRFQSRLEDPMRRWKLSTMDLEARARWADFSRAKDEMFVHTDLPDVPWYVVEADDKRSARLNCIAHLVSKVPFQPVDQSRLTLSKRSKEEAYQRPPRDLSTYVPDHAAQLVERSAPASGPR
jgi:polyphosphate kinase 2